MRKLYGSPFCNNAGSAGHNYRCNAFSMCRHRFCFEANDTYISALLLARMPSGGDSIEPEGPLPASFSLSKKDRCISIALLTVILMICLILASFISPAFAVNETFYPLEKLKEDVRIALEEKGVFSSHSLKEQHKILLPARIKDIPLSQFEGEITCKIEKVAVRHISRQFDATLVCKDEHQRVHTQTFYGRFEEWIEVPVLVHSLKGGESIQAQDIGFVSVNKAKLRRNALIDSQTLVGKTAKRTLLPHMVLTAEDVTVPYVVRKNRMVSMHYKNAVLSITDRGIALDNGAAGDVIRVKNAKSNNVVQAVVEDEENVSVFRFSKNHLASSE